MSLKEFKDQKLDGMLKTIFVSLITSFVVFGIVYLLKLRFIVDFIPKYGFFIFFSILSYSVIMPAIKQVRMYKDFPCMGGMMVGMTIGMISGFLPGFFVASTNGMFYGSLFGMIIGICLGVISGRCCGLMGVLEGMMAGFMGGLMGAMTSVMMLNDNLKAAGIIVFVISSVILTGLNFMIYRETKSFDRKSEGGEMFNVVISFILTTITIWLAVFGPRSVLFQ